MEEEGGDKDEDQDEGGGGRGRVLLPELMFETNPVGNYITGINSGNDFVRSINFLAPKVEAAEDLQKDAAEGCYSRRGSLSLLA